MKKNKFTVAQIECAPKQAEGGASVAEACRKAGIAEARFHSWRKSMGA